MAIGDAIKQAIEGHQGADSTRHRKAHTPIRRYPPHMAREIVELGQRAVAARLRRIGETGDKLDPQTMRLAELVGAELGLYRVKHDRDGRGETAASEPKRPRAANGTGRKNPKREDRNKPKPLNPELQAALDGALAEIDADRSDTSEDRAAP